MDHKCQPQQPTYDRSHSEEGWDISSVKTDIKITDSDIKWLNRGTTDGSVAPWRMVERNPPSLPASRDQIRRYWLEFINCLCLIIFSKGSVAPCVRRNSSQKVIWLNTLSVTLEIIPSTAPTARRASQGGKIVRNLGQTGFLSVFCSRTEIQGQTRTINILGIQQYKSVEVLL